jgi:hypothetical protein
LVAQQARERAREKLQGGAFAPDFSLASSPAPSPLSTSGSSSSSSTSSDTEEENSSLPKDDKINKPTLATPIAVQPTQQQQDQANRESLQIICNYLSPEWQTKFLKHVQQDATTVLNHQEEAPVVKRIRHEEVASHVMVTAADADADHHTKTAPKKSAMSFGQKQLSKVNTKGMKSMTSFFAPKVKKSNNMAEKK